MDLSLWDIIEKGGWAMYLIIALSVLAVGVALERLAVTWRFVDRAKALAQTVVRCLSNGAVAEARTACERSPSAMADVFLVGFEKMGRTSRDSAEGAVDRQRQRTSLEMKGRLWILGTIGATAPFVGLFGTVVGIIKAFKKIGAQNMSGFTVVAPELAEALITTAAGIAVAVEAVAIYNWLNQRAARIASEMKLLCEEYLEAWRDKPAGEDRPRPPEPKERVKDAKDGKEERVPAGEPKPSVA